MMRDNLSEIRAHALGVMADHAADGVPKLICRLYQSQSDAAFYLAGWDRTLVSLQRSRRSHAIQKMMTIIFAVMFLAALAMAVLR